MPEPTRDEFGGVAVDESTDEFGGIPVDEGPLQARTEEVPETVGSTLSHYWDKAQQKLLTLAPRFNRHTIPDALDVLDSLSPERFLAPPGVIAPDDLSAPSREPTPAEQTATGVYNATADAVNSMTSPVGIATLGMGALPKAAQAGVTAAFLGQTAQQTGEAATRAGEASVTGTPEEKAEAYTSLGLQPAMAGIIGHQGTQLFRRSMPVPGAPKGPEPVPEPGQPAPEVVPSPLRTVETKTVGPDGNPIEVLEINKQKKTALVRPEGQPDAPPKVLPLSEVTTKEVPVEQKGPNASSEPKAATPNGNLQPSPEPSAAEVPAQEGGGGIQPETGGGLRQAEAKGSEVSLNELAPEEKALTDAAAESNRQQGLESELEVVSEQPKNGEAPDIAYVENGKIKINAPEFRKWLTRIRPEQRADAVEALLNEEGIHLSVRKAVGDPAVAELWKSLTQVEQSLVKRSYFGKGWKKAETLSDAQMGHEYMRRVLQWGMSMNPREVAASKGNGLEWITQKGIDVALKGIDAVRRTLPTESGRNVRSMLDQVETNLKAVKQSAPTKAAESLAPAQEQVTKVAETQGKRTAKVIKAELVSRLEEALKAPREDSGKFVEIDIPGDGSFKIRNNQGAITEALKAAKRLNTSSGSSRAAPINARGRLTQTQRATYDTTDAIKLYGGTEEAYRRLNSQLERSQELELGPEQVQGLARVVERLKNTIEEPLQVARRRVSDMEDRLEFLTKQFGEKHKSVKAMEENLKAARNEEAAAKIKRDAAIGGEKLYAKAGQRDYPVEVEDAQGNRKKAFFNGYYDLRPVVKEPMISVGYEKPGLAEGELSHGMIMPGEKVIGKIPSVEEWNAMPEMSEKSSAITEAAEYRRKLREASDAEKLSAKGPVRKAVDDLNNRRKALGTIFRAGANRKVMDQTIDAADNKANIVGQQMGNRLRIGTDKLRREAALAVVEAAGDPKKLTDFLAKAQAGNNTDAVRAVRYAQANWARLQPDAVRVKTILDGQISQEQTAGIATEYRDAYVPHIYDRDLLMGTGRPFVIAGGSGTGSGFKKGRTFENIFDAIEAGYTPKTLDVADLVEHRVKVGQKIINRKAWGESLAGLVDPSDGNPISAPLIRKSRGPGRPGYEVAPPGYVAKEILPGIRLGIHEAYRPLFDALTGESQVAGSVPGKLLLEAAGGIKHGLLVFDSFHASRIFQKLLTLAPGKVLSGKAGYERGQSLLEYSDADLSRAVADNLITPEIEAWVRTNRPNANLLIDSGLNVGRIQESLYNSVVRQIPGLGTFNKWVFEKLTRGALMEAGLIELERVSAAKPNVPRGTIAQQVARDLNAYFGNLGRQGIFKSKSAQDVARLVALAPQWVESMARTELKGAAQIAKGTTYDPIVHKTLLTGSIGKGVAQGLIAYFVGTQIVNYITRGHSTFENPEDNHKLDAWIPDVTGKSHGFFLSPFSVVAELTHDMLRYSSKEPTKWEAAMRIASNKASPMARAAKVLLTGRDYDGKQITDTWKRVKQAAFALAPTPIPLAPLIKGSAYPGQTQRQLTASLGFKTEPAESATQQIVGKAKQFMIEVGKKKPVMLEPSEDEPAYYKLRDLLRKDDQPGAEAMLAELRKTHTPKQIMTAMRNHVKRPFTGSRANEVAFRASLSPKDRGVYDKARDEQRQEYRQFLKLWYGKQSP